MVVAIHRAIPRFGGQFNAHEQALPLGPSLPWETALLDLGARWQAALNKERAHYAIWREAMSDAEAKAHEAAGDRLYDVRSALFDRIMELRATSPAGLAVKARILAYEHDVEHPDEDAVAAALASSRYLSDCAALSLALDVLKMARVTA